MVTLRNPLQCRRFFSMATMLWRVFWELKEKRSGNTEKLQSWNYEAVTAPLFKVSIPGPFIKTYSLKIIHETYVALLNVVQVPQAPKNKGRLRSRLNFCSKSGSGQLLNEANFWPKLEENTEFCSWLFAWSVSFSRRNLERWDRNPDISNDFIFHIFFWI